MSGRSGTQWDAVKAKRHHYGYSNGFGVSTEQFGNTLAILGCVALPGALCRHKAATFDEARTLEPTEVVEARHAQARGLCQRCPALENCTTWVESLQARQRPTGIVAGRLYRSAQPRVTDATPEPVTEAAAATDATNR